MEFNKPSYLNVVSGNIAENFKDFKEEINIFMVATETVKKPNDVQVARLKNLMGPEALKLYRSIRTADGDKETVLSILNDLEAYCVSRKNEMMEVFNFFNRRQGPHERFDQFYGDLKLLIATCDFKDQEDKLLKVQLILGMKSVEFRERLLREDLSLKNIVEFCKSLEMAGTNKQVIVPQGIKEDVFLMEKTNCSCDAGKNKNSPNFRGKGLSNSNISIKQEKTDLNEFGCGLFHVKQEEEILIPVDGTSNSGGVIKEEKKDETESTCTSNSEVVTEEEKKDETESTCDLSNLDKLQNIIFQCNYCKYKTLRRFHLKVHVMGRHKREKPHQCPNCDYKATQISHIKRHIMARHTGEKPFQCPHCDFKSAQIYNLKSHIMHRHTHEKPYKCPHCNYKAVVLSRIKRHVTACH